jgi:rhodanese-related sulfurtransferase
MFAFLMGLPSISPDHLYRRLLDAEPFGLFDVNSIQSWSRAHVPGAHPLDPSAFMENDLPRDRNALLVFYCSNPMCMKAPIAARRAKKMGYPNAKVMPAGINGWIAAKLPNEAG